MGDLSLMDMLQSDNVTMEQLKHMKELYEKVERITAICSMRDLENALEEEREGKEKIGEFREENEGQEAYK